MNSWIWFLIDHWFWLLLGVALAFPIGVIFYGQKKHLAPHRKEWLKEIVVPVMTSLVVAVVGICFALESERRQHADTESDRQTSLMRELMVSQDRHDTSYLLALDLALNIHLHRYIEMKKGKPAEDTTFEEEAAFFFYSKHRAALINLRSNKGNLVFRRIWMENVFEQLAIHVVECVLCASEQDPKVSAQGESATYKLFGARAPTASDTNSGKNDQAQGLGGHPMALADFDRLINDRDKSVDPLDLARIKQEFKDFQERLHNGDKDPPVDPYINTQELINALLATQGLVAYSYNTLFSVWYGLSPDDIPTHVKDVPKDPPKHFLEFMWHDFKPLPPKDFTGDWQAQRGKEWNTRRHDAWQLILRFRPEEPTGSGSP